MKIIDVQDPNLTVESLLTAASGEDIVLTENGHVRARVERFDDADWDDWLFEHDPENARSTITARERWERGEGISLAEVREELKA